MQIGRMPTVASTALDDPVRSSSKGAAPNKGWVETRGPKAAMAKRVSFMLNPWLRLCCQARKGETAAIGNEDGWGKDATMG